MLMLVCMCVHVRVCVCISVSFTSIPYRYHIDQYDEFPTFEINMKSSFWGCHEPLCKTVLWPLEDRRKPSHTTNSEQFQTFH